MDPYDYKRREARIPEPEQKAPVRRVQVPGNWDTTKNDLTKYKMTQQELAARKAQRAPKQRFNEPLVSTVEHATDYLRDIYDEGDDNVKEHLVDALAERGVQKDQTQREILAELDDLRKRVAELSRPTDERGEQKQCVNSPQRTEAQGQSEQTGVEQGQNAVYKANASSLNEALLAQANRLTERLVNLQVEHAELADVCAKLQIENTQLAEQLRAVQAELQAQKQAADSREMAELDDVLEKMKIL